VQSTGQGQWCSSIPYKIMTTVARPFAVAVAIVWILRFWGVFTMKMYERLGRPEALPAFWSIFRLAFCAES
jgi:hypothetical protein